LRLVSTEIGKTSATSSRELERQPGRSRYPLQFLERRACLQSTNIDF